MRNCTSVNAGPKQLSHAVRHRRSPLMMVALGAALSALVLGGCGSDDEGLGIEVRSAEVPIGATTTKAPLAAQAERVPQAQLPAESAPAVETPRSPGQVSGMLHLSEGETFAHVVIEREDGTFVARHEAASTGPFAFEGLEPGTYRLRNGAESTPVTDEFGATISSQWSARGDLFILENGQDAYFICGLDHQVCTPG